MNINRQNMKIKSQMIAVVCVGMLLAGSSLWAAEKTYSGGTIVLSGTLETTGESVTNYGVAGWTNNLKLRDSASACRPLTSWARRALRLPRPLPH